MLGTGQHSPIEAVWRRDRLVVLAGLALVAALAWGWTLAGAGMPMGEGDAAMARSPGHAAGVFLMWWVMMAAMMVPSAAPLVLLAAALQRRRGRDPHPGTVAGLLTAGYLAAWGAFSLAATIAHLGLEGAGLLVPATMAAGPALAGALLVAAGLYQLTPLKRACLRRCRSPAVFLASRWRPGAAGALRLGLVHGVYCVGCCWFLMALLFVGGVMNPLWIAALALYVLVEKLGPGGLRMSRASGLALVAAGVFVLAWHA